MQIELTEEEVAAIERWVLRHCRLTAVGHLGVSLGVAGALLTKVAAAIRWWASLLCSQRCAAALALSFFCPDNPAHLQSSPL